MGKNAGTANGSERGTGSIVSAEFNLAYRWHSCISAKDDQWVQDFYRDLFGKDPLHLTTHDMMMGFAKFEKSIRMCFLLPFSPSRSPEWGNEQDR